VRALLTAVVLALVACRTTELPPLAEQTLAAATRRGARAPDPDSLREAVVRLYLGSLPTQTTVVLQAAEELCLGIDAQIPPSLMDELVPPAPPPPGMPLEALDPSRGFLARFAGEHPAVVASSSCSEPTFMMEVMPIRSWSFEDAEFEVPVYVAYGPVGSIWTYTADRRNGLGW
jgi:hypothetical protein